MKDHPEPSLSRARRQPEGPRRRRQKGRGVQPRSFAVVLTKGVGSMLSAYLFALIALASLPAILTQTGWVSAPAVAHFLRSPGLILIVAWIAQTFLQLVLLSVIMVGQGVQGAASDDRAVKTYKDTMDPRPA